MSTALDIATGPSNRLRNVSRDEVKFAMIRKKTYRTFSTNNNHFGALVKALTVQLTALDASSNNSCAALPIPRSSVFLEKLDIFEAVRVDDKRAVTGRSTPVITLSVNISIRVTHFLT